MAMTFQTHDGLSARSDELHRHILHSHLAYLNQEECPAKLQQRRNLENLIMDFLSIVNHNDKFTFYEVAQILNDSIDNNVNFSAYKAGSAFEALEKYATNLISHPWRKEYKSVKLYSGFYKHSVENQLIRGSSVFHLLGYRFEDDGVLYLDEPVDPDKTARVALDCLIAYVECQIMVHICERVKSFKCSWFEIHQVRQDYMCGVDECVRILQQMKRNATAEVNKQERWLREQENGVMRESKDFLKNDPGTHYQKTGILVDVSNTWPSNSSTYNNYDTEEVLKPSIIQPYASKPHKPSVFSHSKLPSWSEGVSSQITSYPSRSYITKADEIDCFQSHSIDEPSGYSFGGSKTTAFNSRYKNSDLTPDSWKNSLEMLETPGYQDRNESSFVTCDHDSHRGSYNGSVPNHKETYCSQFGHMYPPHSIIPLGVPTYPVPSFPNSEPCQCHSYCEHPLTHKYPVGADFDSPHRSPHRVESTRTDDPTDLCSSFLNMDISNPIKSRHFPVSSAFTPYQSNSNSTSSVLKPNKLQPNPSKRSSFYDNVPSPLESETNSSFSAVGASLNSKCDFGTLPSTSTLLKPTKKPSLTDSPPSKPLLKKSVSNPVPDIDPYPKRADTKVVRVHTNKWSCPSCTYYNVQEKSICDMCGRSRNPGPEIAPLVSGGRECPQCTLVNKKDCEDCSACGASLKDSPTYI